MIAIAILFVALQAVLIGAHDELAVTAPGGKQPRSLLSISQRKEHIWGRCSRSGGNSGGCRGNWGVCYLRDAQCSDHLSDGPADADVEVTLTGVPASTAQQDVHLQWWSAYESPTSYDPLLSLVNVSVYSNVRDAYPKYYDDAFNGGNVRVPESGTVTLRIRSPATYFVWPFVSLPHIHLRICKGDNYAELGAGSVIFGEADAWVLRGNHAPGMSLSHVGPYTPAVGAVSPAESSPQAVGYVTSVNTVEQGTTTMAPTTTTLSDEERQVIIDAAKEDFVDLDALEFSSVYECLLEDTFFDHISEDCASSCPAGTVVAHAQCVVPETQEAEQTFGSVWNLQMICSNFTECLHDKMAVTLHQLRINVASLLDIPFQEVTNVQLNFDTIISRRRLSDVSGVNLHINVTTQRHAADDGEDLLETLVPDAAAASELLGIEVQSVQLLSQDTEEGEEISQVGEDNDPYTPAYDAAEGNGDDDSIEGVIASLPLEIIIAIAVLIFAVGVALGFALWFRHRMRVKKALEEQVQGKIVGKVQEPKVPESNESNAAAATYNI
jgi:hypothetical protein